MFDYDKATQHLRDMIADGPAATISDVRDNYTSAVASVAVRTGNVVLDTAAMLPELPASVSLISAAIGLGFVATESPQSQVPEAEPMVRAMADLLADVVRWTVIDSYEKKLKETTNAETGSGSD